MRQSKFSYNAVPWWEIQKRPVEIKRAKVLVKEIYENSILITGLTIPEGYKVQSLYIRPNTNPPKFNKVTDCWITLERQLLFLEKPTKEFPINKHVIVQYCREDGN